MTDLESLRKIAEAATPGPWHTDRGTKYLRVKAGDRFVMEPQPFGCRTDADATHIATFNPSTALSLIAVAQAADEVLRPCLEVILHSHDSLVMSNIDPKTGRVEDAAAREGIARHDNAIELLHALNAALRAAMAGMEK